MEFDNENFEEVTLYDSIFVSGVSEDEIFHRIKA